MSSRGNEYKIDDDEEEIKLEQEIKNHHLHLNFNQDSARQEDDIRCSSVVSQRNIQLESFHTDRSNKGSFRGLGKIVPVMFNIQPLNVSEVSHMDTK